jgi:ferritin
MPLDPAIATLINNHLPNEAHASSVYQRLADDCRALGFEGIAHWLAENSAEEHGHLQKMMDFLSEWDVLADVPARIAEPMPKDLPAERYAYIQAVLQEVLALEETVTGQIEVMTSQARDIGCWIGFDFLMEFIEEQSTSERYLRKLLRILPVYGSNLNDFDHLVGSA